MINQMKKKDFKILLVDDEPDILEILSYNLDQEGYQIFTAKNGKEALKIAQEVLPHLIVLDVMMPEMDGMEACVELRKLPQLSQTIITFLTARSEDYSQLAGFEAGADDYIAKPIKPKVLVSKIKAMLRRFNENDIIETKDKIVEVGPIKIDRESYKVYVDKREVILPRKEFELLFLLASKPGKVFTRQEIMTTIWGTEVIVGGRTIDVHMRKLREKLNDDLFVTIKGVGYKLEI
jgi:two-component system alkaline phosphatase synthesis response regulator PhoP